MYSNLSCSSTSSPWHVFFFGALLWGSMIHKHSGRWMWQGSASDVPWNWEKNLVIPNWFQPCQCCCCPCCPGEYLRLGTLISYNWARALEACDCLKLCQHVPISFAVRVTGTCWQRPTSSAVMKFRDFSCQSRKLTQRVSNLSRACIKPLKYFLDSQFNSADNDTTFVFKTMF